MKVTETAIDGLFVVEPQVFHDERGYFFESYNLQKFPQFEGKWVQDNESKSTKGVLRGLHYQCGIMAQAKLVRAIVGEIYDVAVDIRNGSNTYGKWYGVRLSAQNKKQMYIPRGFAHGFMVLSDVAIFSYKCDNYYSKKDEGGIMYNDPSLKIEWPLDNIDVNLSEKDKQLPQFGQHRSV